VTLALCIDHHNFAFLRASNQPSATLQRSYTYIFRFKHLILQCNQHEGNPSNAAMQQDQDVKRQRQGPANLERVGAERESDLKTVLALIYRWRNLAVTSLFCNDEGLAVEESIQQCNHVRHCCMWIALARLK